MNQRFQLMFADRCAKREERIAALTVETEDARATAVEVLRRELHDIIGEASVLGLAKVSTTAIRLTALVRAWTPDAGAASLTQLVVWVRTLVTIARSFALEAATPEAAPATAPAALEQLDAELPGRPS